MDIIQSDHRAHHLRTQANLPVVKVNLQHSQVAVMNGWKVLQIGEYVSLGKVEAALAQSQYVEALCVYAESCQTFVVCLVVPRPKQLKALAVSLGVHTDDMAEQCRNRAIQDAVLNDLQVERNTNKVCYD